MGVRTRAQRRKSERMSDTSFRLMLLAFKLLDFLYPYIGRRVRTFGIREGTVVVDYGCGPGRYTMHFARLVGPSGKVYAVDIHELAIETVKEKAARYRLQNVVPVLAHGYDSTLPDHVADVVCAIDMFFGVKRPSEFLDELRRIAKAEGTLVIGDGHQPRAVTKRKILESGHWRIQEETRDHLKCKPL